MSNIKKEESYLVAINEDREIVFMISSKIGDPDNPSIIYDGKDHALFSRGNGEFIVLDYINPDIRSKLARAKEVVILEMKKDEILNAYYADLNIVNTVPINFKELGLKTWDEALKDF